MSGAEAFGDKKFTTRTLGRPGQDFYYRNLNRDSSKDKDRKYGSIVLQGRCDV